MTNRHMILHAALPVGLGLAWAISASTHEAPSLWPHSMSPQVEMERLMGDHNIPTWTKSLQRQFPDCTKAHPTLAAEVIAVHQDASVERIDFDTAWRMTHNKSWGDDIWIVGIC